MNATGLSFLLGVFIGALSCQSAEGSSALNSYIQVETGALVGVRRHQAELRLRDAGFALGYYSKDQFNRLSATKMILLPPPESVGAILASKKMDAPGHLEKWMQIIVYVGKDEYTIASGNKTYITGP